MTTVTSTVEQAAVRTLIAEAQSDQPAQGIWYYGYSLYATGSTFEGVVRIRTYDGVRVASKWDSESIALVAATKDDAITEIARKTSATMRALLGGGNDEPAATAQEKA